LLNGVAGSAQGPFGLAWLQIEFLAAAAVVLLSLLLAAWGLAGRIRAQKAHRALEHERDILCTAISAGGAGFLALDRWGGIVHAGDNFERLLNLPGRPDRLEHLAAETSLGPDGHDELIEHLEVLKRDGEPFTLRRPIRTGERIVQIKGRRTPGTLSTGPLLVLSARDVTHDAQTAAEIDEQSERLDQERQRLADLLNTAPFPIWRFGANLKLAWANQAYVAAVGARDLEEVLRHQPDLVDAAPSGGIRHLARQVLADGRALVQRQFGVIDGRRHSLTLTCVPLSDGAAGYAVDSTDEEQARSELKRYLDSQSDMLNLLSTPVAIFRPDQRLRYFNSAFAKLTDLAPSFLDSEPAHDELLQAMLERRRLPEQADFAAWKRQRQRLFRNLIEPAEEMWHLPDGTTWRVVTQPEPMGGVLMLLEDVTSDLQLKRSYNTQIAVQRETLNNLREAVSVFGADGRLKLYNPAYADLWGLDTDYLESEPHAAEVLERCRPHYQHPDYSWEQTTSHWLGKLIDREPHAGRAERPDRRIIDWAVVPLPDGRTLATSADVTEAASYQRALRERNEALEAADRLKTDFVANMSYELRTPLNSIIGFTGLLMDRRRGQLDDKTAEYLSYIRDSADQLRDLIDSILDLALIEAGGMTLDMTEFAICELLSDVSRAVEKQIRSGQLLLSVECDGQTVGRMHGDRKRFHQALQNLVYNAIKFTPPGGHVAIGAERSNGMIQFWVTDDGIGLDAEDMDALAQNYAQIPRDGQGNGRALGLGLPLVQSFVKLHGGSIDVRSTPEEGTTVTCRLPAEPPPPLRP